MEYYFSEPVSAPTPPEYDVQDAAKRANRTGLALFAWTIISSVAALIIAFVISIVAPNMDETYFGWTVTILALYGCAAPISYIIFRTVPAEKAQPRKMTPSAFVKFVLIAFALMIAGALIGTVINSGIEIVLGIEQESAVGDAVEDSALWLTILYTVIMAPILEEIFFRKLLIDRLSPLGQWACILVSGITFGLFHGNIEQFCYATLLGFLLGYLYYNTRNIGYCICIHAILNFVCGVSSVIVTELLGVNFFDETLTEEAYAALVQSHAMEYLITMFVMFLPYLLAIGGLVYFLISYKKLFAFIEPCPIPKGKRFKTVALNPGMILFTIACVGTMITYIFSSIVA